VQSFDKLRTNGLDGKGQVAIDQIAFQSIFAHASDAVPHECCGLLLGENGAITHTQPTANVHPDPERHFEIDPKALIAAHKAERAGGPQVIGYYHSHPTGDPEPSATDRTQAAHDGKVWAIVAQNEIRFFRDGEEGFAALSYRVLPR